MKYDQLDEAIISAIRGGAERFYLINAAVEELAKPHSVRGDAYRVVDRRLQALSRSYRIQYWRGRWRLRTAQGDGN